MKVLNVTNSDFFGDDDWLTIDKVKEFKEGGYTHLSYCGIESGNIQQEPEATNVVSFGSGDFGVYYGAIDL